MVNKNLFLLFGEEKYELNRQLEKIKAGFENLEPGINYFVIIKDNINQLESTLENTTFFGTKKLVIIKETDLKFDVGNLYDIDEDTTLCIIEDDVDKRLSQYKELSKIAQILEFKHLDKGDMIAFVMQVLKRYNLNISRQEAEYFTDICGEDKNNNINELKKLVSFLDPNSVVTKSDIDKVCSKNLNAKLFDMLNDIVNKKKKLALEKLDQLIMLKEPIVKIYVMLYKQVRQMYMIKYLKNIGAKDIASILGIHPFAFKNLNLSVEKYSLEDLKKIIFMFDNYDEKTKNGELDFEIGLKEIISLM